ncbi:hypothetical protein LSAT2_022266 [Lamellibrachia satsuma]|nr:hypothetical protein LSAT2_022266 [Lamellibrachia satsuma]
MGVATSSRERNRRYSGGERIVGPGDGDAASVELVVINDNVNHCLWHGEQTGGRRGTEALRAILGDRTKEERGSGPGPGPGHRGSCHNDDKVRVITATDASALGQSKQALILQRAIKTAWPRYYGTHTTPGGRRQRHSTRHTLCRVVSLIIPLTVGRPSLVSRRFALHVIGHPVTATMRLPLVLPPTTMPGAHAHAVNGM